jgi:heat shock protein HslJ
MRAIAVAIVGLAVIAAACTTAGASPAPSGATGGDLTGRTWVLASYASNGSQQPVPAGVSADAEFATTTVSGFGGCNAFNGPYQANGATLKIGPLAATQVACPGPTGELEAAFFDGLGKTAGYSATAGSLTMVDVNGGQTLVFTAGAAGTLTGATWHLTAYNNGKGAVTSVEAGSDPTAVFGQDASITGNASCNTYQGRYLATARIIKIGPLATTMLACASPALSAQESAYLAALARAATWSVDGTRLELRDANGSLQAQYVSRP